jgi:hypothetical protein
MRTLHAPFAVLVLLVAACSSTPEKPEAKPEGPAAPVPAVLLAPDVALEGGNASSAGDLATRLRAAVAAELGKARILVVDDPAERHDFTVKLSAHVTYWGMDGASTQAKLALEGGAPLASFEHFTGTVEREREDHPSFAIEARTDDYPAHVAATLVGALLASEHAPKLRAAQ